MRKHTQPFEALQQFDEVVVISNHHATNYRRAQHLADYMLKHVSVDRITYLETVKGGQEPNDELLSKVKAFDESSTLVMTVMGDGGLSITAQHLMQRESKAVVLPLPGGNACDLTNSLYGSTKSRTILDRLKQSAPKEFYPMCSEITDYRSGEAREEMALAYVSLGMSSDVAQRLNSPLLRKNKYVQSLAEAPLVRNGIETAITLGSVAVHKKFSLSFQDEGSDTTPRELHELIISNVPRMAKHGHFPVNAYQQEVALVALANKNVISMADAAWELTHSNRLCTIWPTEAPIIFQACSDVMAQIDGEPFSLREGDVMRITHSQQPLRVLAPVR